MGLHLRGKNWRSQNGDTIVEVLIALSVVSLILVGAFVTSNRSAAATRDSQEHAEASQLLTSQIELVRTMVANYSSDATDPLTTGSSLFCIDLTKPATPTQLNFTNYPNSNKTLLPIATDDFSKYPNPGCMQSAAGYNYNIVIENNATNPTDVAPNTLLFVARWDSGGGGRNQVEFTYRIHAIVAGTNGSKTSGGTLPACTIKPTATNLIRNPDFDVTPALGTLDVTEASSSQYTSFIPYRGDNIYPDDLAVEGQYPNQHVFGGFSIYTNGNPVKISNLKDTDQGPPYNQYGVKLGPNKVPDGHDVKNFFYSNPVVSVAQAQAGVGFPGEYTFKGIIWTQSNITVSPNTRYQYQMWVSNIKLAQPDPGYSGTHVDPLIELTVLDGTNVIADLGGSTGVDIPHLPLNDNTSPSEWELVDVNVDTGSSTNLTLQIIDHAGRIHDDNFTMTGLGLYKCS